uniref:hypothetical protein n=1 Tax=Candidatus Electrothrix sp. TaxID=2170559 RepID=UPI004055DDE4
GGAEDNHGTDFGTDSTYAMAILADNQTRTDLYSAMKARRFYSTADKNLGLYLLWTARLWVQRLKAAATASPSRQTMEGTRSLILLNS